MRIVHTADWHLGKMFYGEYLTEEQHYVLTEQFLPLLRDEHIDAVVLAGDVYDRSLPPAEAVALFDEISTKITAELGIPFILISGNHDSASRLSFGSRLLAKQQLYIAGEFEKLSGPIYLADQWGDVAFGPVPFAEPAMVRHFLDAADVVDHQTALERLCQWQQQAVPPKARTVCIAHAFVAGGTTSDSERPLSVGGSDNVEPLVFDGFSYTALGHLHGPQQVGSPNVRYAGSLLKYSFSEANQKKGVVIVDLDQAGKAATSAIPLVPRRDVRILKGSFDEIMAAADDRCDDFVLARLTDAAPILDGMAKLRRKYPHALALETPNRERDGVAADRSFDLRHSTEQQLFDSFAQSARDGQPLSDSERACIDELWKDMGEEGHLS